MTKGLPFPKAPEHLVAGVAGHVRPSTSNSAIRAVSSRPESVSTGTTSVGTGREVCYDSLAWGLGAAACGLIPYGDSTA